ncbi:MAG: Dipeptidyl aminopeptidase/acylaminoacyl-peptidase-like protein [Cyanobacteria bacterium RYN_339]|nr:Dipeptidyl aminopeptidase/acylaminoacyl-peptidase-like protein [Cyanobacteria bacterium RYN_339]
MTKTKLSRVVGIGMALAVAGCGTLPHQTAVTSKTATASALMLRSSDSMEGFMANAFTTADKDRDGVLSGKEAGMTAAQFKVMDRDSDGTLSHEEWNYRLPENQTNAALVPFQPLVDETFKAIDANKDGLLSNEEVRALAPASDRNVAPEPIKLGAVLGALHRADANGDGAITKAEFPAFYTIISQDGGSRGWFGNIAQVLMGGYLAVTSRLGEHIALHPSRKKNDQGTPAKFGYAFEEVSFKTSDGLTIRGWYIPAAHPTDKSVIEAHGINDCRDTFVREGQIKMLHEDYNQLAFDLRNQGTSDGKITSFGLFEARDVIAASTWLHAHGSNHVAAYGISLGASAVMNAAAQDHSIEGVIDDCAFSTVRSAFAGFANITFIPCPELIAAAILVRGNEELGADMTAGQPISVAHRINPRPLLIIHGANDPNIPPEDSSLNFQAAGEGFHKELWFAPGAGHAVSAVVQPKAYEEHLKSFLNVAFGGAAGFPVPKI